MADLQQLEESIVSLSLLEAADLVKKLEARLGVSAAAAAPVMMAGGGAGAEGAMHAATNANGLARCQPGCAPAMMATTGIL